jgi:hypothetical protein
MTLVSMSLASTVSSVPAATTTDASAAACPAATQSEAQPELDFVRIPAGRFQMGSDLGRDHWDEHPMRLVEITTPFEITRTEITNAQFRAFRPSHAPGAPDQAPATGVSWHDAAQFCASLGVRDGLVHRLPTEAEWEYACRAGTESLYSSGDAPPKVGADGASGPNAWGVVGMHDGAGEWCADWYAPYDPRDVEDPAGPASGLMRVVRGASLDDPGRRASRQLYSHSAGRSAIAPAFGPLDAGAPREDDRLRRRPGLVGVWFATEKFERPQFIDLFDRMENNWINDVARGARWSGRWVGSVRMPAGGRVTLRIEAVPQGTLSVGGAEISSSEGRGAETTLSVEAGDVLPIGLTFVRDAAGETLLRASWSWDGQPFRVIDSDAISFDEDDERAILASGAAPPPLPGSHRIGFRVVRGRSAPIPSARVDLPHAMRGVAAGDSATLALGPDPSKPYFRKRHLLPTPPENASAPDIDAIGLHRSFRNHNHCPALEVCPNGDVLCVLFTSATEYEPEVTFMATRLRRGADDWDMPSRFLGFAQSNNHAPLLWTDWSRGRMWFFWGSPRLEGAFPFQWTTSDDSGATWDEVRFPRFIGPIGPHTRQPINTVLRDSRGTMFVASDGNGGRSVLWATDDDGATWRDTGGRSIGRHTTYALERDGTTLLGFGGKNCEIDGFMPVVRSTDGGAIWTASKTPFPEVGGNQRPSVLRLASGRLCFASDFQHIQKPQPAGVTGRGAFVALSDDDGATWRIRPLPGAQPHENREYHGGAATIGYSAMRQGPDGIVHLVTTMNEPCLHFAFNEAWILGEGSDDALEGDGAMEAGRGGAVGPARRLSSALGATSDPDGLAEFGLARCADGSVVRDGGEVWRNAQGAVLYECSWIAGRRAGLERSLGSDGRIEWEREHASDGTSVLRIYDDSGHLRSRSNWSGSRASGVAELLDAEGRVLRRREFP